MSIKPRKPQITCLSKGLSPYIATRGLVQLFLDFVLLLKPLKILQKYSRYSITLALPLSSDINIFCCTCGFRNLYLFIFPFIFTLELTL